MTGKEVVNLIDKLEQEGMSAEKSLRLFVTSKLTTHRKTITENH